MATPLEISIALHYFTRPGDYGRDCGDFNFKAPAVQDTFNNFLDRELLIANPAPGCAPVYKAGPALDAWIAALCSVQFPIKQWIVPPCASS